MPQSTRERWDADQCAKYLRIKVSTWWKYQSKNESREPAMRIYPEPLPRRDPVTGKKMWDAEQVREFGRNRPGRGARTDLKVKAAKAARKGRRVRTTADTVRV